MVADVVLLGIYIGAFNRFFPSGKYNTLACPIADISNKLSEFLCYAGVRLEVHCSASSGPSSALESVQCPFLKAVVSNSIRHW